MGAERAAIIDPGPALDGHLAILAEAVSRATNVVILLTHAHEDHAEGAADLASMLGVEALGPGGERDIGEGQAFATSCGDLVAVSTPGHARQHFCFHLPDAATVFVGDLVLGEGDTTWVGEYRASIADYLTSLDKLEGLGSRVLYPGHGPTIRDPRATIGRFRRHRESRIEMVRGALAQGHADPVAITRHVYGELEGMVQSMAVASVEAMLDYLSRAQ